jgi:hypothetical protein
MFGAMRAPCFFAFFVMAPAIIAACSSDSPKAPSPGGPDAATPIDGGSTPTPEGGTGCSKGTGPTTHSGSVGSETWTAATSPHVLVADTSVTGTLTIEPCAEVQIAAAKSFTFGSAAKLIATGTADKPIHIGKKDDAAFASIRAANGGTVQLAYVTVDGGGDPQNSIPDIAGMIDLQGIDQGQPTQPIITVDHVTLSGSKSNGIVLHDGAGFASGSNALTITGSAQYPINIWSRAVDGVPTGTYTGNTHDEIVLPATGGNEAIRDDATMHNRGAPYLIGTSTSQGTLYVAKGPAGGLATLTIEAGVTIKVKKGGVVSIEPSVGTTPATGALIAVGTAAAPIVFTSAEATPAAGDWLGVYFGLTPAATDKMDHVHVDYAGGASTSGGAACNVPPVGKMNDAAIRIFGPPASEFVTNTTISHSAAHGIDRGWTGTATDFAPTNTFVDIARCTESYPRALTAPACPATVPCPTP